MHWTEHWFPVGLASTASGARHAGFSTSRQKAKNSHPSGEERQCSRKRCRADARRPGVGIKLISLAFGHGDGIQIPFI
jgi:hypothetical protein